LLVDLVEQYGVPEPDRLELLQKIRILKSLGDTTLRRQMLVIRLLAIAVFAHTATEASAQSKLFLYEPELIPQLAELVHPDRSVPIEIQAAAFYALDALAKFKTKLGEVASALNAGVSHGILMYVVRRTITDLEGDSPTSTPEFIDSLFNLLMYFQTNSFVGNMIVGAGIVPMLVDFNKNQRRDRIAVSRRKSDRERIVTDSACVPRSFFKTVTKAVVFLDSLMYGYSSAFTLFISAGGLAVFIDRIKVSVCR
jgi:E3 ubiquitin-protein ligase HUWE1